MENNEKDFYENLFGEDVKANNEKKEDGADKPEGSVFDINAGKTFAGVGDIGENRKKNLLKGIGYVGGGNLSLLIGLSIWASRGSFLLGLILLGVGAFLLYAMVIEYQTQCPHCRRLGGMEVIYSEDLSIGEDITHYRVYQGARHTHDEVDVDTYTTMREFEQCSYCGYTGNAVRTKKTGAQTYKK